MTFMSGDKTMNELGEKPAKLVPMSAPTGFMCNLSESTYTNRIDHELWEKLGESIWDKIWNSVTGLGDDILHDFKEKEK